MTRSGTAHYGMRAQTTAARKGGRRPREVEEKFQEYDLTDEDKDKRAKRRQRNKEAAARCRKRRLDLMESLQLQVDALREENRQKQMIIEQLTQQKNKLDDMLRHNCNMNGESMKEDMTMYQPSSDMLMKHEVDEFETQQRLLHQRISNNDIDMYKEDNMMAPGSPSNSYSAISSCSMLINNDPVMSQAVGQPHKRQRMSPLHELDHQQHHIQNVNHAFVRPTTLPLSSAQYIPNEMSLPSITTPSSGLTSDYNSLLNQQTFLTPLVPGAVPVPLQTPPHNTDLRQL